MSRSAHQKSTYRLKPLPKCSKCNKEMVLVMVCYENKRGNFWEWECLKCNKFYPRNVIKEEEDQEQNIFLNKWCENDRKRRDREKGFGRIMQNHRQ